LQDLSVLLSSSSSVHGGVNDELAILLGRHSHVQGLCFRAAAVPEDDEHDDSLEDCSNDDNHKCSSSLSSKTLTDRGLLELMPRLPLLEEDHVLDCWEEVDDDDDDQDNEDVYNDFFHKCNMEATLDALQIEGCNVRLRRLELLNCQHLSAEAVLQFLGKCSGITHLSLAGSFLRSSQDGMDIVSELPNVLPNLQVLDVTRCPWLTTTLLSSIMEEYVELRTGGGNLTPPPRVYFQGGNSIHDKQQVDDDAMIRDWW